MLWINQVSGILTSKPFVYITPCNCCRFLNPQQYNGKNYQRKSSHLSKLQFPQTKTRLRLTTKRNAILCIYVYVLRVKQTSTFAITVQCIQRVTHHLSCSSNLLTHSKTQTLDVHIKPLNRTTSTTKTMMMSMWRSDRIVTRPDAANRPRDI